MTTINAKNLEKMIGISLSDEAADKLQAQLTTIMNYVEKITEFSGDKPEYFADKRVSTTITHEDKACDCDAAQALLAGAPLKERTYIAVPKYIGDQV